MSEPTITVRDLIQRINGALAKMKKTNPHRALLIHCGRALVELASRTHTPADEPVLYKPVETIQ